jgi:hypothetical protein
MAGGAAEASSKLGSRQCGESEIHLLYVSGGTKIGLGEFSESYTHIYPEHRKYIMSILISLLITVLVIFLVLYLVQMLPLDGRAKQIVQVIVVVIGIISLLRYLAVF